MLIGSVAISSCLVLYAVLAGTKHEGKKQTTVAERKAHDIDLSVTASTSKTAAAIPDKKSARIPVFSKAIGTAYALRSLKSPWQKNFPTDAIFT